MSTNIEAPFNLKNEKLAAMIEESNSDPHIYILAFMVRNGIMDNLDQALQYAKSEKLIPHDYLEALLTLISLRVVKLLPANDLDRFDEILNTTTELFRIIFGETLLRQMILNERRKSDKKD